MRKPFRKIASEGRKRQAQEPHGVLGTNWRRGLMVSKDRVIEAAAFLRNFNRDVRPVGNIAGAEKGCAAEIKRPLLPPPTHISNGLPRSCHCIRHGHHEDEVGSGKSAARIQSRPRKKKHSRRDSGNESVRARGIIIGRRSTNESNQAANQTAGPTAKRRSQAKFRTYFFGT